jgi:pimeloyl-ACP methyl ester carboxylesterase
MAESNETLFLDSGGLKLAYDIRPSVGPALLCVHGNSSHRGLWSPLQSNLPESAR